MSPKLSCVDITNKNWLPHQRPLTDRKKTNFRLIIYGHDFANHENLAKIGVVVFEISVLPEIAKK